MWKYVAVCAVWVILLANVARAAEPITYLLHETSGEVPEVVVAALEGDTERVKRLVEAGADPKTTYEVCCEVEDENLDVQRWTEKRTLLWVAMGSKNEELALFLLERGALEPEALAETLRSAVHLHQSAVARKLLTFPGAEAAIDARLWSLAISEDQLEVVRLLDRFPRPAEIRDLSDRWTGWVRSAEMVQLLVELGFQVRASREPSSPNGEIWSRLPVEHQAHAPEIARALLEAGAEMPHAPLAFVVPTSLETVAFWKERGAKYSDLSPEQQFQVLCMALGSLDTLRMLRAEGLDFTATDPTFGHTLLHRCSHWRGPEGEALVDFLLEAGVDPMRRDSRGETALDNASSPEIAWRLLKMNVPCKLENLVACFEQKTDFVRYFIENQIEFDARDVVRPLVNEWPYGEHASERLNVIRLLRDAGRFDLNAPESVFCLFYHGGNAVDYWIPLLVKEGADPNAQDAKGETPLYYLIRKGFTSNAITLVRNGAEVNHRSKSGLTPLSCAIACEREELVDFLLENGAVSDDWE